MDRKKRSGGPRTSEGKLVASKNAIKTGAYSATVILPGENEQDFRRLEEQFVEDFAPQDIAEAAMVRELAVLTWKRLRLERIEHSVLLREIRKPIDFLHELRDDDDFVPDECRWLADEVELLTPEFIARHRLIAQSADWVSEQEINDALLSALRASHPEFMKAALELAKEHFEFDDDEDPLDELLGLEMEEEVDEDQRPFLIWAAEELASKASQVRWAASNLDRLKEFVAGIRGQRLMRILRLPNSGRVNDDLSRAFFRTLTELRRHQQWRRQINIVDVTPEGDRDTHSGDVST